ncbi:hypothetical protein APK15_35 [Acinetobacter phage APK15]|uniref:Uncharacterized protein n=1 Tax=Acinetobacter phage APK15 TaxID=2873374 RepID=A0AAE9BSG1_9CAUD|nr:hypothetical protein APK15_35 [Acinetobacter phage APK15]
MAHILSSMWAFFFEVALIEGKKLI